MDVILVPHPAGGFIPAGLAYPAAPGAAGLPAAVVPAAAVGLPDLGMDAEGFKTVRARKYGMARGSFRGQEDDVTPEPVPAIELEFEWHPATGNVRKIRKWAMVRKAGIIATPEGPAVITYPCHAPVSN